MSDAPQHQELTRADLEALKQDLRVEIQETEARISARVEHQIQETEARISARVEHQIQETEARITNNLVERMRDMQTELLRGFERYARALNARVMQHQATLGTHDDRLLALEERLTQIEKRLLDLSLPH